MGLQTSIMSSWKIPTRLGIFATAMLFLARPAHAGSAAAAASAAPTAAAADDSGPSNAECLSCHNKTVQRKKGPPIPPIGPAFTGSVHDQMAVACVDCHSDLAGAKMPHPTKLAVPDCSQCHEDEVKAYNKSIHASARRASPTSPAAWCTDCHGVHDILTSKDPRSRTYHFNVVKTCSRCHANKAIIAEAHIKAGNVPAVFQDSIHGRALSKSGLVVAPNCATCHGHHEIRRASDPKSRVYRLNIPKTCGSCHEGILTVYQTSIHATALRAGNPRAPVCSDCHTAHAVTEANSAFKMRVVHECGTCHRESIRTFRDTFHGKVSTLGFARAATCADCHGAHGILPPTDPRSTVSSLHRLQTCRKCHQGATAKFAQYDPHADDHNRLRDPALFYISRAMRLLLISVFVFFGLHTLLWLGRSLVLVRKLQARGKIDDGE